VSIDLDGTEDETPGKGTAKRGPGRPKKSESTADLERDMKDQLEELGEWIGKRDPEFADTFMQDIGRQAAFLAARAAKHERLARFLRIVFAKDGPLAALRAFGRTARALMDKLPARRHDEPDADFYVDDDGNTRDREGNVVVPRV